MKTGLLRDFPVRAADQNCLRLPLLMEMMMTIAMAVAANQVGESTEDSSKLVRVMIRTEIALQTSKDPNYEPSCIRSSSMIVPILLKI